MNRKQVKAYRTSLEKKAVNGSVRGSLAMTPAHFMALQCIAETAGAVSTRGTSVGQPSWRALLRNIAEMDEADWPAFASLLDLSEMDDPAPAQPQSAAAADAIRNATKDRTGKKGMKRQMVYTSLMLRVDLFVQLTRLASLTGSTTKHGPAAGDPSWRALANRVACLDPDHGWQALALLINSTPAPPYPSVDIAELV